MNFLNPITSGKLIGEAGIPTGGGQAGFNPDGNLLAVATGTGTKIYIWDANSPELLYRVSLDIGSGASVPPLFNVTGDLLLTVGSDIRLWGIKEK